MKPIILIAAFLVAISGNLQAQEKKMSKEEMKKAWEVYAAPGEMQKMLAKSDGNWTEEIIMWMDPGLPPTKSTAKVTNMMKLGGRYQHSKHEGMMEGKPFEGYAVTGYDNAKKMFQCTWIDNMGTGIMFMEGKYDPATKTVHYKGMSVDPVTGKDMMYRQEFIMVDDNTQKLEMYMTMPGMGEMKSMEIVMKREMKKPAGK